MIRAMVRRVSVFIAVVGSGLLSAVPADAATPAFEFDIEAKRGSVVVMVNLEPVPPGFNRAAFEASGVADELVGCRQPKRSTNAGTLLARTFSACHLCVQSRKGSISPRSPSIRVGGLSSHGR